MSAGDYSFGPRFFHWPIDQPLYETAVRVGMLKRCSRARHALVRGGYRTPEAVRNATDEELLAIMNLGRKSLALIREAFPQSFT